MSPIADLPDAVVNGVVGRVDEGDSRWYVDPADPDRRFESVTAILSAATSKPWLTRWSAKLAAEYTAANLDELVETHVVEGPAAVIQLVKGAAERFRELKAEIGSHQHNVMEALILDTKIPDVPEHLVDVEVDGERVDHDELSDGILNFVADFDVTPRLAEATVASVFWGYAGTLDLIGDLGRSPLGPRARRGLIDLKTGTNLDVAVRAQLGAYRRADEVWLDRLGNKAGMPRVDFAAVLHVRKSHRRGYKLVPVPTDETSWEWFKACQKVLAHQQEQAKIPRGVWYPPRPDGSQPPPYLEDVEQAGFTCRNALIAAGIETVEDLARFTTAELRAVRGVGPKALDVIAAVLAAHHLSPLTAGVTS